MLWSIVFPLGMYAVATCHLSLADDYPPIQALSHLMAWVALGAWIATTASLIVASARSFRKFARSNLIDQGSESGLTRWGPQQHRELIMVLSRALSTEFDASLVLDDTQVMSGKVEDHGHVLGTRVLESARLV
jgi:hypothetical protein